MMEVRIHTIRDSGAARVFELRALDGEQLPAYDAGAHIDVALGNGLTRQYSLCCRQPGGDSYRIAVKREPQSRGGSAWLHEQAKVGMPLRIGAPRNAFALTSSSGPHLLFAGGIGVTPVLAMAYALLRRGEAFRMVCFVRDRDSVCFADELLDGPLAPFVDLHIGLGPEQSAASIEAALGVAPGTQVYVCGPGPFMQAVSAQASARFGAACVHQESFGPAREDDSAQRDFIVRLQRSGREIKVPAGSTALACLLEAGVELDCSCEVGVCGTCRTTVLQGIPEHLDTVLSEEERHANRCFMPCVSRAKSPVLVLDI